MHYPWNSQQLLYTIAGLRVAQEKSQRKKKRRFAQERPLFAATSQKAFPAKSCDRQEVGRLTHALNVVLPLHAVCTRVQVNFRNGAHTLLFPLLLPSLMWRDTKLGQILLIAPRHKLCLGNQPLGAEWKILTSIQKQNNHHLQVFSGAEGMKEDSVLTGAALITQESAQNDVKGRVEHTVDFNLFT